jgi:phosphohistidine phosphatase SixA
VVLLLVRHGHAGSKKKWRGDDRLRPLTPQGLAEAEALTLLLFRFAPSRIISSPYVRCVQTVTPLAHELGVRVERTKRLVPSAGDSAESFTRRVSRSDTGAVVLCSHGEVISHLQEMLRRSAPDLFDESAQYEKGSVWILDRVDGRIVNSTYLSTTDGPSIPSEGF